MEVKVLFFGVIAEVTGINYKNYMKVNSLNQLMLRIKDDFPDVANYNFRMSINNEIIDNDQLLKDGDEVALLPPFAGG
jgi:sulfur-carrier protein